MKAVVWHGIGDIRLDDVPDPKVEQPTDAVVRLTASAISGTDLHFVRGTFSGMREGTILGHEAAASFPIGKAMNKNLSMNAGNCNHRAYIPKLVEMVRTGVIDPVQVLTKVEALTDAIEAYEHFDRREAGWIKTELKLAAE